MSTPSNTDDVIDSRDVISRYEELRAEFDDRFEEAKKEDTDLIDFDEWFESILTDNNDEYYDDAVEMQNLEALISEADTCGDWEHGATLISEGYFTEYIEELINDCYEMPKEMKSGNWPFNHMTMDYESAAEEAKVDYAEVRFDGVTYLIRD